MKVQHKGFAKAFAQLPRKQHKYIGDAVRKSVIKGVALAKSMAPIGSGSGGPDLG